MAEDNEKEEGSEYVTEDGHKVNKVTGVITGPDGEYLGQLM